MGTFSINGFSIRGISAAVPKTVIKNAEYSELSPNKRALLIKTIGVEEKRHAKDGTTAGDLCEIAANKLLAELNWNQSEIGVLLFVTQSADYYLPSTAIILQHKLGLSSQCIAFDINLGCSGYVYGLSVLASLMKSSNTKKGMLLCGDISSLTCSIKDKSTYPLFGDAGTATALELSSAKESIFDLNSDGSRFEAIHIPHGGARNKLDQQKSFEFVEQEPGIVRSPLNLNLNGLDVFNFSITTVPSSLKNLLSESQNASDTIDYFVMHQANKLMNEMIRKKLGFSDEQCPYSLQFYGNTSSASIPLTIVTQLKSDLEQNRRKILLTGFGVGLSWSSLITDVDQLCLPELIECDA